LYLGLPLASKIFSLAFSNSKAFSFSNILLAVVSGLSIAHSFALGLNESDLTVVSATFISLPLPSNDK